jgi:hypothetical protein
MAQWKLCQLPPLKKSNKNSEINYDPRQSLGVLLRNLANFAKGSFALIQILFEAEPRGIRPVEIKDENLYLYTLEDFLKELTSSLPHPKRLVSSQQKCSGFRSGGNSGFYLLTIH